MASRNGWGAMEAEIEAASFEVQVLGPVAIYRDGAQLDLRGKPALLVSLLVARAGDVVNVDSLIDGLWGEEPPATARKAVQVNVSNARRVLGAEFPLETARGGYRVARNRLSIDAQRFLVAVDKAAELIDFSAESAVGVLNDALALWRGSPYASFADNEELLGQIVLLNEQRVRATRLLFDARLRLGEHTEVVGELDAATVEHPYDEDLRQLHMLALYRSGRQTEALRAFDHTRELLIDAGLEPSPELKQLSDDILHHRDRLGGPADFSRSIRAGNLPVPRSELIGRDQQIARIKELLDEYRLVTLTGVGGVGKTSLALAAGRSCAAEYPDGCWLVELGNVLGPEHVTSALLDSFGIQPQRGTSAGDALRDALVGLRPLVILDNCEHVLRGAVEVTDRLLDEVPDITIIATSREGLGLRGEYQLTVPSLETRGPTSEAAELFRQRASENGWEEVDGDETVIEELCSRLDGIPLAIELAAARTRSMTVAQLRDRLGDRFRLLKGVRRGVERHQTLHAMLAWSYDLLAADEQTIFNRACVFTGSFDLSAAECVLSDRQVDGLSVGEHLGSLVNKSMLTAERGAFDMLETMRQFGEHEIGDHDLVRNKHCGYYASFVVEAHDGHLGADEGVWSSRLEAAWSNVRAAFGWAMETGDTDAALTIVGHLGHGFINHPHAVEVYDWARRVIDVPGSADHPLYASCVGIAAIGLATTSGDLETAHVLAERAVAAIAEHSVDLDQLALRSLGLVLAFSGRLDEAAALSRQYLEASKECHPTIQAMHLVNHAFLQSMDLRHAEARTTAELALAMARETGHPTAIALSLHIQATAIGSEDPDQALPLYDEALAAVAGSATWTARVIRQAKAHTLMDLGRSSDALQLGLETGWALRRRGELFLAADALFVCARALEAMDDPHTAALLFGASLWANVDGFRGPRRIALRAQLAEWLGETSAADLIEVGRAMTVHEALELTDSAAALA